MSNPSPTRTEPDRHLRELVRIPFVAPSTGGFLITVLLCIKLALSIWNAAMFDGKIYDQIHHQDRALFGGLRAGKMAYNGPLYYLPALLVHRPADVPLVERSSKSEGEDEEAIASREAASSPVGPSEKTHRQKLLTLLRYTNIFWGLVTYLGWIYFAFPRLLRGFRAWFLASLLLLAIPGFQKLGVMVHPDNAFAALTTVGVCVWLWVRDRYRAGTLSFRHLILFAVAAGGIGLTRPFAAVPVTVLTAVLLVYLVKLGGWRWRWLVPRAAVLVAIAAALSVSWFAYRWRYTGHVTNAYRDRYIQSFERRRPGFDFVSYFTSFHVSDLLDTPNRRLGPGSRNNSPDANSFFTLLYSEVWADHWLYFSGSQRSERKLWPKRALLTAALATPAIVLALGAGFWLDIVRRSRRLLAEQRQHPWRERARLALERFELDLVLLGIAGLGAGLYLYWQTGPALLPGKNSTIKFVYIASLCGPAIALLFRRRLKPLSFNVLTAYFLILFVLSIPVAMFWPS
jgi:hypothetical protein